MRHILKLNLQANGKLKAEQKAAASSNGEEITQKLEHQNCASSLAAIQQGRWTESKQER